MALLNVCYNGGQIECRRTELGTDGLDENTLRQIEISKAELDYILLGKDFYKAIGLLKKKYNEFLY